MKKLKWYAKKRAQELVEFLLVAPFIIIMLGILTEYAYALSINMTLTQGLKTVTSSIYSKIQPSMTQNDIKALVQNNLIEYLKNNNVPLGAENALEVGYVISGNNAVFMSSYKYFPAFTLPNIYFHFMPEEFDFFATSSVPAVFLKPNNYSSSINSLSLDNIWSNTADFSNQDTFNGSKRGIMNTVIGLNPTTQTQTIFLIPQAPSLYSIVDWQGNVDANCTFDSASGLLLGAACTNNGVRFLTYLQDNKYLKIVFVHDSQTPSDLVSLATYWTIGSGKLSDSGVTGILKRELVLADLGGLSIGNYDNIDVSTYNSGISAGNSYKTDTFGSMVFIHTKDDTISGITGGETAVGYDYNFGD